MSHNPQNLFALVSCCVTKSINMIWQTYHGVSNVLTRFRDNSHRNDTLRDSNFRDDSHSQLYPLGTVPSRL